MKLKKIATGILLAATLFVSGCSNGKNKEVANDEFVTISFSHWGGQDALDNEYQDRIDAFEAENENIKVKIISVADNYETKIQTMMAGNEAPDVIQVAENGAMFASKNQFIDLTEYYKKSKIDVSETWGELANQYFYNNQYYAAPDRGGQTIVYYNKDHFDKVGIEYPTNDWDIEDYSAAIKTLTIKDETGEIEQFGGSGLEWSAIFGAFLKANGGSFVKDGKIVINSPENLDTLTWYKEIYDEGWVVPYEALEGIPYNSPDPLFTQGKLSILYSGFWNIKSFSEMEDLNFDIVPTPVGTENVSWPFGSALAISKQSPNKDAAWRFIEFMTGETGQEILGSSLADCPANMKVVGSSEFIDRKINNKELNLETLPVSTSRVVVDEIITGPYYAELNTEAENQVQEMLLGRLSPKEALEKMQENMELILDKY